MSSRLMITIVVIAVLTTVAACRESVRGELSRLQKQTGLTLAWYYTGVNTVNFAQRATSTDRHKPLPDKFYNALLSPDSTELAFPAPGPDPQAHLTLVRRDGAIIADYPELRDALALCWSHDKSKLVVQAKASDTGRPQQHLFVLDLRSHAAAQFGEGGAYATAQCWSPDDKKLVYAAEDNISIYDLSATNSRSLAQGREPTWSPDGHWIAFSRKDGYYSTSAGGGELRRVFKTKQGRSGFFWSPDSRFAAYLGTGGTFRETLRYLDVGLVQLRVVRLSDGAEDWIWQTPDVPPAWPLQFVWVNLPKASN